MPDWAFHWIGYTLTAIAALLVTWSFFADRSRGRSRCRKCWYDLTGLDSLPATCPECSKLHTKPKHLKRTCRRKRWAVVGMLLLIPSYGSWTTPRIIDRGWVGAVPTTAMVVAAPWVNNKWCRSHEVSEQLLEEFKDRMYGTQSALLLRSLGQYWSCVGVNNVWPMSDSDLVSSARNRNSVADYLFIQFLKNGYGSRTDQIEYVKRSMFRGYGLSLNGTPIYNAEREIVGVTIDYATKGPSNRPLLVYLGSPEINQSFAYKPSRPYNQRILDQYANSLRLKSQEVTLWLNPNAICTSLVWIESARGMDLGCYRIEWSLSPDYLEDGTGFVFLDQGRWGIISD